MSRRPNFWTFCIVSLLSLSISSNVVLVSSSEDEQVVLPDFSKMRVKELNAFLEERGVTCNGCAEKSDLIKRVEETFHLPIQSSSVIDDTAAASGDQNERTADREPLTDEKLDELLKGLGGAGRGYKVFRPEDLKKFKKGDWEKKFKDEF
ncbi:hypothetical protein CEUSTIGMA_g6160.t1 [Chlamydomonas eustigma]|uniref:Mesencephalic astrocyte-derived neurotrophic factor homolog n=1 Tax=Chlamydomonas eustigma TaxID=1157962 RepID=A0A250X756_9CHLO|nr:hypothetical protein CEUSTIGMA_g6160.t1 [Chlamydomonas eustigma]|eukprot:GAX78722.1 hypothetical protein CEUSTIGMA_g6160.t1 [Chlamydomonas eustigma]